MRDPHILEDMKLLLTELRSLGVQEAHFHDEKMAFVKFFPAPPPPRAQADEEPAVGLERDARRTKARSLDSRLFDPLGIGETGQPKPGGEG